MAGLPEPLLQLVKCLRRLPGVGGRSAERMALRLVMEKDAWPDQLARLITDVRAVVSLCPECGFFSLDGGLCEICQDTGRDRKTVCVVEGPQDVLCIERTGGYRGIYHCLGGKISPLDGVGMEDLSVDRLMRRLAVGEVEEVVLALGSDVEGETTTLQLAAELKKLPLRVSRLAQGISVGGGLDNHDPQTLAHAVASRCPL